MCILFGHLFLDEEAFIHIFFQGSMFSVNKLVDKYVDKFLV